MPVITVIPFLLGKHLTDVQLTPYTNADGVLTPGAMQSIHGLVGEFDLEPTTETDDIRGIDIDQANAVPTGYDAQLNLTVLLRSDANAALLNAWDYEYFHVTAFVGPDTADIWGLVTTLPIRIDSRQHNSYRIGFKQFLPFVDGVAQSPVTLTGS